MILMDEHGGQYVARIPEVARPEQDDRPTDPVPIVRPPNPGIGGSAIAAIVGKGRRTAYEVWAELTGKLSPPSRDELPEWMRWGTRFERPILEAYAEEKNAIDLVPMFDQLVVHPERSWHVGHPDGDRPKAEITVEAKNVSTWEAHRFGEAGTDDVPEEYVVTGTWYMSLMKREVMHLAGLFGGNTLRVFVLELNKTLEEILLERGHRFWVGHVQADVPPPMEAGQGVDRYIRQAFPRHEEPMREAREDETELAWKLAMLRRYIADKEREAEVFENILKLTIGKGEGIEGDGFSITHRRSKDSVRPDFEAIAASHRHTLQLIASDGSGDAALMREVALEALAEESNLTKVKRGSRRFLPSGPLFKEGRLLNG